MNFFGRVGQLIKGANPGNASFLGLLLSGGSGRSFTGKVISENLALKISAVYACVRNLSEDVAKLKPEVFKFEKTDHGDGRKKVLAGKHPLRVMLQKPNAYQDRFQFFETLMFALTLRGNAYVFVGRDDLRRPRRMSPIHPDRVTVLEAEDGSLFYRVSSSGAFERGQVGQASVVIPASEMMHIRGLSSDGIVGLSPLQMAANTFSLASTAEEQQEGLFARGARPGGVLKHPGKITKEAGERLKSDWDNANGGSSNAGKTVLLEESMDWQPMGMTSLDAEFLSTRRFSVEEIARFFRMPLHMIGDLSKSTNNNIAHQGLEYYTNTLSGYLERIEAAFDAFFELGPDYVFEFDTWALMRLDLSTLMKTFAAGKHAGLISTNEARRVMGFNPVEGGDKVEDPLNIGTRQASVEASPEEVGPDA